MKLSVGFITYNEATAKYLGDFLPSLKKALRFLNPADCRVYVFDNSDKTNLLNKQLLLPHADIEYFSQGHNLGFARAYNILIRQAIKDKAEFFLVINPDTIMNPDSIKLLVDALDNDGSLGSVAPKILRWDFIGKQRTNKIDSLGLVLKSGLGFADYKQGMPDNGEKTPLEILAPSGAAGLFRLSSLEKIAEKRLGSQEFEYFDERFFMYKEDCDLAYRLYLAGFKSCLVPGAVVYHDRTATVSGKGISDFWQDRQSKSRKIRAWSFRNQHLIFLKYWKKQNFVNKIFIGIKLLILLLFSLILEQYLLKEYVFLGRLSRGLTNIK